MTKQAAPTHPLFSSRALKRLLIPLIIEQTLAVTVGMVDIMMIATVGEVAVSGVSLVDMLNVLIINIFAALSTGGAVVAAQFIGAREPDRACQAAKHLLLVVAVISCVFMALVLPLRTPVLRLLFGSIESDVMQSALIYFWITALSYPFIAIYNACAALFRAQGNSRVSMLVSLAANAVNIAGNALFLFVFHMGVAGVALSTLISRIMSAAITTYLLRQPVYDVSLSRGGKFRFDPGMIGRILNIGVPNGFENSLFQLGRILVVGIIAHFGTTQIAANAVANTLDSVGILPGQAISLAIITVVGQCVGAADYEQARYYARRLLKITYIFIIALNIILLTLLPWILPIYNLTPETMELSRILIFIHNGSAMLLWPLSFTLPNVLRAANDVRYTMVVAILSMFFLRIGGSFLLAESMQWGAIGVWIAMVADWICRALFFSVRMHGDKWEKQKTAVSA